MRRLTSAAPTTALRLELKTCGLFDSWVTDEAEGKVASVTDDLAATNLDLMSLCGGDILEKSLTEANIFDLPSPNVGLDDDFPFDFGEEFMDLSDFLLGGNEGSATAPAGPSKNVIPATPAAPFAKVPVPAPTPSPASTNTRKRPALVLDEEYSAPASPVDHCNYTRKRPRLSTVSSDLAESDTESVVSTSSSSTKVTALERKTVRRIKNNIASRRSRETRKSKFQLMEEEAQELEKRNKELSQKVIELEALAKQMKAVLVKRLANSPALI